MVYIPISLLGLVVAVCEHDLYVRSKIEPDEWHAAHQLALSTGRLAQFILDAPRDSVVSANKEGLISLTGSLTSYPCV